MQKSRRSDLILQITDELTSLMVDHFGGKIAGLDVEFIYPPDPALGDLSTNIALKKASILKRRPTEVAGDLLALIEKSPLSKHFSRIEVAGPGFLNFTYSDFFIRETLHLIEKSGEHYGSDTAGQGKNIIFEFVSANPTGPLTIAHARQAAVGDTLCRLFRKLGFQVCAEYYLNDRGVQMRLLGESLYIRYLELCGKSTVFPENGYKGDYLIDMAREIFEKEGAGFLDMDREEAVGLFSEKAKETIFHGIQEDLKLFRVSFDSWFSEKAMEEKGLIEKAIQTLKEKDLVFEKDGALWFRTTDYGDDKDRVLVKSDASTTYLASDIPYHWDKLERGFDRLVNIVGPDHHGYISRLHAAVASYGPEHEKKLMPLIVQLSTLYRGETQLRMSTRAGEFISLSRLLQEVGIDAGRYFFVSRRPSSHLDFDLELAKKQTPENPVFYVQYVHARVTSVFRKYEELFPGRPVCALKDICEDVIEEDDRALVKIFLRFPDAVRSAALNYEPQRITNYLENLAAGFHSYYNKNKILDKENPQRMDIRLHIIKSLAQVIRNGLDLIGVEAPDKM